MKKRNFTCNECYQDFSIDSWWKWLLTIPHPHYANYYFVKCPCCRRYYWLTGKRGRD